MKITKLRYHNQIPSTDLVLDLERTLRRRLASAGFITEVNALTRTSMKIGLRMRSFKIDRAMHNRNLRHNPHLPSVLTDSPTWAQRVEFNNIVNNVLDKFCLSANVRSGLFTIRRGVKCMTEQDWHDQKPWHIVYNETVGFFIEACDEREYLKEQRIKRNERARQRRLAKKQEAA